MGGRDRSYNRRLPPISVPSRTGFPPTWLLQKRTGWRTPGWFEIDRWRARSPRAGARSSCGPDRWFRLGRAKPSLRPWDRGAPLLTGCRPVSPLSFRPLRAAYESSSRRIERDATKAAPVQAQQIAPRVADLQQDQRDWPMTRWADDEPTVAVAGEAGKHRPDRRRRRGRSSRRKSVRRSR